MKRKYVEIQTSFVICNRYKGTSFRASPISNDENIVGIKIFGNKKNPKTPLKKGKNYVH
jgi:hypothetical protein